MAPEKIEYSSRLRRGIVAAAALGLLLLPAPAIADSSSGKAPAAVRYTMTLTPSTTTSEVGASVTLSVTATPSRLVAGKNAVLQWRKGGRWKGIEFVRLDTAGRGSTSVTSSKATSRIYRVILRNSTGLKVLATSRSASVTWKPPAPPPYSPTLACDVGSATVGVWVNCTLRISPIAGVSTLLPMMQVVNRDDTWQDMGPFPVSPLTGSGVRAITGLERGLGQYRVLLYREGILIATSNTTTIGWTDPEEPNAPLAARRHHASVVS